MKKLFLLIALVLVSKYLSAQHYGGFTFTPYAVENNISFTKYYNWKNNIQSPKITFGYTFGYQGLLMPEKRFSFSYGIQYNFQYNEAIYNPPFYGYNEDHQITSTMTGSRVEIQSIQIPLWWRFNILKKKKKLQPYIAVSPTLIYPLKYKQTFYYDDNPNIINDYSDGIKLSLDVGLGMNYYHKDWLFNIQATYSAHYMRKLGLSFSIMRKF